MLSILGKAAEYIYSAATVANFHPLERSCPNKKLYAVLDQPGVSTSCGYFIFLAFFFNALHL